MIYVVKYNGLFQHRDEAWFPDLYSAEEHVRRLCALDPDELAHHKFNVEERSNLTFSTGSKLCKVAI